MASQVPDPYDAVIGDVARLRLSLDPKTLLRRPAFVAALTALGLSYPTALCIANRAFNSGEADTVSAFNAVREAVDRGHLRIQSDLESARRLTREVSILHRLLQQPEFIG